MPTILSIETSSELASVALLHGERIFTLESSGVQTHSQTVLPMAQQLLAQAGLTLRQCDAIAFGMGPGSFTGVRTACGVAQGLAFGADLPVVPIVTLEAVAQACHERNGRPDVLVALDARMGEVYWAQYRRSQDEWTVVAEPALSRPSEVQPLGPVIACGSGLNAYAEAFSGLLAQAAETDLAPHAVQIARLARIAYARHRIVTAREAQPLYLRNKVALTTQERLAKVPV